MVINLKNPEVERAPQQLTRETGERVSDRMAYATARHAALPLLFKGDDLSRTDLERA